MSEVAKDFLSKFVFYALCVSWFFLIWFYFTLKVPLLQEENRVQDELREIRESPASSFFVYESVLSVKETYEKWEPIKMESTRAWKMNYPIGGVDVLMCNTFDGRWYDLISSKVRGPFSIEIGEVNKKGWTYEWELPQNPQWTYVEADCYIRSEVLMSPMGIPKRQILRSNVFSIR